MLLITLDYIAGSDNPSILLPPPSADDAGFGKVCRVLSLFVNLT